MVVGRLAAAERRLGMKEALGSRRARAVEFPVRASVWAACSSSRM